MPMTERERILAVLEGRAPDRIPWVPRLELWYQARKLTGTLDGRWEGLSLREIERELGVGTPARTGKIMDEVRDGVEVTTRREDGREITEIHTPRGMVRSVKRFSETLDEVGLPGRVEEYFLKGPEDYWVWEYVLENTRWTPLYEQYRAYDREVGEDGLPMVKAGDVPVHEFAQSLAGYEYAFYQLADHPREVERLLSVMHEVHRERLWPILADSPARLLLHGLHLSSQFTPPPLFERYVKPYYREMMPLLHRAGKAVAMHADADTSQILREIGETGWDMMECFVTAPMVPLTLRQAREAWGSKVIIWGGIPSNLLSPSVPEEEFRSYVHGVFDVIAPGDAFILGVADNVMPDSMIDRIAWITETVERRGGYPVSRA